VTLLRTLAYASSRTDHPAPRRVYGCMNGTGGMKSRLSVAASAILYRTAAGMPFSSLWASNFKNVLTKNIGLSRQLLLSFCGSWFGAPRDDVPLKAGDSLCAGAWAGRQREHDKFSTFVTYLFLVGRLYTAFVPRGNGILLLCLLSARFAHHPPAARRRCCCFALAFHAARSTLHLLPAAGARARAGGTPALPSLSWRTAGRRPLSLTGS